MNKALSVLAICIALGCTSDNPEIDAPEKVAEDPETSWSIPKEKVLGPYSPFPLVTNSSFIGVDEVNYSDNHLTTLISLGTNELRAYPNAFIALYEVINNEFEDKTYALTHCPLTGSTICFDRMVDENILTIKASGYLFNDNIMPTDIETGTIWSQMLMRGVSGKYDGERHKTYNAVETDWKTVKDYFPHAKVYNEIVDNTEVIESPRTLPTNRSFYRYGILAGINGINVHLFNYDLFGNEGLTLITTTITGKKVLVVGNKNLNFITSYFVDSNREYFSDGISSLTFSDNLGNIYNAMGLVIEGSDKDLQLKSSKAYTASLAAWQDFFDDFVIYE